MQADLDNAPVLDEILDLARAHTPSPPPLSELAERFDLGDTLQAQNGSLSGGQRRRLALALAFLNLVESRLDLAGVR